MEKISVIVTCYNIEKFIGKCLTSIKKQTINNYEVIIVDDGSTDNSANVIKKIIKNDKRFQYYKKKNGGVSTARNYGLKKAKGDFICFIDGDDYLEKDYLEILYSAVSSGEYDFSICNIKRVYKNKISLNQIARSDAVECKYPALWNKMCKKELIDKYNIKFLENIWYEDLAFGAEVYLVCNDFIVTDSYIYNYIQHENSLSRATDDRIFDIYKITEEIEEFAKKNNVYESKFSTIEFISIYHILVGTIYRASFHKKFSSKLIKEIYLRVIEKYPNWNKNKHIKNLPLFYRIYLIVLRLRCFFIIYLLLKLLNKKIHL